MVPTKFPLGSREMRNLISEITSIDSLLKDRVDLENPVTFNLPDLLRPQQKDETAEQFHQRQDRELKDFIENRVWLLKDGRKLTIGMTPPMLEFMTDMFFRRVHQAILWKGRGTGGSLCSAILVWMMLIFHKMSFTVAAGSAEQAKQIYNYTKTLWECAPEFARTMLAAEPLQSETRIKNGVVLKIISASEKQARGKHNPGILIDESCQAADNTDQMLLAAMQGAMSEPNYMVVLVSTFHHPIGLFQEIWDFAEERGFKRYWWNVFDSMIKCDVGLEEATPEDPKAIKFCEEKCPLTERVPVFSDEGIQTGWRVKGCKGKARDTNGFLPRKNVIIAKKMNRGTNVFAVEYENERPNWMRPVYDAEWVERSLVDANWPPPNDFIVVEKSVGIDWGLEGQTALVLTALMKSKKLELVSSSAPHRRFVVVLESEFMTGKLTAEALRILNSWVEKYGPDKLYVYGDYSHPFNNLEVENAGFDTRRVLFGKWKDYGIGNITKYFTAKNRLFIRNSLVALVEQLKRYRQDKMGRPVKRDDHGPDALLCAMLHFPFEERFGEDMELTPEELGPDPMKVPKFDGMVSPVSQTHPVIEVTVKEVKPLKTQTTQDGQVVLI